MPEPIIRGFIREDDGYLRQADGGEPAQFYRVYWPDCEGYKWPIAERLTMEEALTAHRQRANHSIPPFHLTPADARVAA